MKNTHSKHRRKLALVAGFATAALALVGCAGAAPDGGSGDGAAKPDTTEAAETNGEPVTIDVWGWNPDEASSAAYIDAFEAANPDIKVNYRFITNQDYFNAIRLAVTTEDGPDVFGLQAGVQPAQYASLTTDMSPYMDELMGSDWKERLNTDEQFNVDGHQVAMPWNTAGTGFMWANQTEIDKLGLEIPTNLEELKQFVADAKAAGKIGLVHGAKDGWQNLDLFQIIANQVAPGKFYQAMDGEVPFDDPDFIKAFDTWTMLFEDGIVQDGALGYTAYPDANDARLRGDALLIVFGAAQFRDTTNKRMAEYAEIQGMPEISDTIFMPYDFPLIVDGGTPGTLYGGPDVGWAMSAQSQKKDAAAQFIYWLTSTEEGAQLLAVNLRPSALLGAELDLSDVKTPEQVAAIESYLERSEDLIGPRELSDPDVKETLIQMLSSTASGQVSSADAVQQVQAAIDAAN